MHHPRSTLMFVACAWLIAATAGAVPLRLNHHGVIEQSGSPVSGDLELTFNLYASPADTLPFWSETLMVRVDDGYYSVLLGATSTLEAADLQAAPEPELGIAVEAGAEMTPRLRVASVPYALAASRAQVAEELDCTACIAATEVAFSYAGSASAGGPAQALECSEACVQATELDNASVTNSKIAPNAVNWTVQSSRVG